MLIKNLAKSIIADGHDIVDYVPVGVAEIRSKASLELNGGLKIDVSFQHFTLAYNPLVVGVILPKNLTAHQLEDSMLKISNAGKELDSVIKLQYFKNVPEAENETISFMLFKCSHAVNIQLNWFRRNIILWWRYLNNRSAKKYFNTLPYSLHLQYAAIFSFPRKVGLATVKHNGEFKSFPIDLHGAIQETNQYVWGIRHSNSANASILTSEKIVISDIPYASYKSVYALGKFKSHEKKIEEGPVATALWHFELPGFISAYKEIELIHSEDIGSQRLFLGTVRSNKKLRDCELLHHVHMLAFLKNAKRFVT